MTDQAPELPPTPPEGPVTVFELEDSNRRGTWWPAATTTGRTAMITCPACGVNGHLGNHTILADGTVAEGLACGDEECTWESAARLEGWAAVGVNLS